VARAVGGGASAPSSSFASLERTLDRTIDCLVGSAQNREARALLIEARRLRSVIANWRSIPPPSDVYDEMLDRVLQLSTAVGAAFPESADELKTIAMDPRAPPGAPHREQEETEAYALDFEPHLYSLETATNHPALPLPSAMPDFDDSPAQSEEEPTRAWSNTALQAPPDLLEAAAPPPAPWPVEEPIGRISSIITTGAPVPAARPAAGAMMGGVAAAARAGGAPSLEPPARDSSPGPAPRIHTYEFDAEGDDLSVPRTQISAHAVKLADPLSPLLVVLTDPYSPRADAYRTLRRKLAGTPNARALGITSASPGEGKTVFAANLALTLRESTRSRVLLIEANLRTPIMAKLLGFETPECFIVQLARHAEDPRAPWVVAEPLPKLHVMAIDPATPRDPVLDPVTFSMGMDRLKQAGYEYVIVDSPPVLGSLDCNVISDAVDAMILTALPMKSLRREMRKAVTQLEPAPILGVVVLEA